MKRNLSTQARLIPTTAPIEEKMRLGGKTEIIVEPEEPRITLKRIFAAPRQLVFEAWTNPEHVKHWYKLSNATMSSCDIDLRVGGRWRVVLYANGREQSFGGKYREISAPERLVQTLHYDGAPHAEAVETLTFIEREGKTLLTSTVVHTSAENRDWHVSSGMEEGANEILDSLALHLRNAGKASVLSAEQARIPERISRGNSRKIRWVLGMAALLIALGLGGAWLYSALHRVVAVHYVTEKVGRGSVTRTLGADGIVNATASTEIRANVPGRIEALYCSLGARVKAGELCARIDPRPYQANVDRAKADLAAAQGQLERDEAALARAEARGTSRAAIARTRDHIEQDKAGIVRRRKAFDAAETDLAGTRISSPADGTVVSRSVEIGQTVETKQQTRLFLVAPDLATIEVVANVSAEQANEIKLGSEGDFAVEVLPDRVFAGKVREIRPTGEVLIRAPNSDLSLKPGMRATCEIVVDRRDDVLRVPDQALLYATSRANGGGSEAPSDGRQRLWVLRNGKAIAVAVQLGLNDGAYTELVNGGLQAEDEVIVGEKGGH